MRNPCKFMLFDYVNTLSPNNRFKSCYLIHISLKDLADTMPKKFKFKLETVLKLRKILKDQQETRLAHANRACQETQAHIDSLNQEQRITYQYMIDNVEQGFSLVDQRNQEAFNAKIIGERARENVRLAKREKAKEFEKARYVRQAQAFKAIEKLKARALELHQKELLDEEMKQIDDLVNSRYRAENI